MPLWVQKLLAITATAGLLYVIGYALGAASVQKEWDMDKAERAAVVKAEKQRNTKNLQDLQDKHKKEVEYAKSQAGRNAINRFLREHGLLPDGSKVSNGHSVSEADIPKGTDDTSCQSGTAERIGWFAGKCAEDARRVRMCTEWAVREGLPVK